MFDDDQVRAIDAIVKSISRECAENPVANLGEGHIKAVCLAALLKAGFSVMEGANRPDTGRVLRLDEGKLTQRLEQRPHMPPAPGSTKDKNSPDVRVWEPCRLVVELQVRSEYGSQSAIATDNIADDLSRIDRGTAQLFVLAADFPLYLALLGLRSDLRGRRAKHSFKADLPAPVLMKPDVTVVEQGTACGDRNGVAFLTPASFGVTRVVSAIWAAP